jgi:hypothetical protein
VTPGIASSFLHLDQIVAMMNGKRRRPDRVARIFVRLVGDDDDALGAFGGDLAGDLRHGEAAVVGAGRRSSPPRR